MERRFFVTIFAPNQSAFTDLRKYDLDLFGGSSRKRGESSIGGLLSEANIKKVRRAKYRVEVHEEYVEQARQSAAQSAQSAPVEVMDDREWLEAFYGRKKVK